MISLPLQVLSANGAFADYALSGVEDVTLSVIIEKIEDIFQEKLSNIASLTLKHCWKDLKQKPPSLIALKTVSVISYGGLLAAGFLTTAASFNLVGNADFPSAFSSDIDVRVNFANEFTNVGALFACVTDLPAITYVLYCFLLKEGHIHAHKELLSESYQTCLEANPTLPSAMREELYSWYTEKLQHLGVRDFYLNPDPKSPTGSLHAALAPTLLQISQEIEEESSFCNNFCTLLSRAAVLFKRDSCAKKTAKVAMGAIVAFTWALSTFLIIENIILLKDTPLSQLFTGSKEEQINEAFYITQEGSGFSALTAIGAATYMGYRLFFQSSYRELLREKIKASFAKYSENLPLPLRSVLTRIEQTYLAHT